MFNFPWALFIIIAGKNEAFCCCYRLASWYTDLFKVLISVVWVLWTRLSHKLRFVTFGWGQTWGTHFSLWRVNMFYSKYFFIRRENSHSERYLLNWMPDCLFLIPLQVLGLLWARNCSLQFMYHFVPKCRLRIQSNLSVR